MRRAVLVTGASRGIGRAIAQAFARQGDRVAVHHRDSAGLAREVLAGLPGSGHAIVRADLADPEAVRQMVDQAAADLGGLNVLVNNAGIYHWHTITEVSYDQWQDAWRDTLAVNLTGAANVTWCAVQHMRQTGGRIVNVSSRGAFRGEPSSSSILSCGVQVLELDPCILGCEAPVDTPAGVVARCLPGHDLPL